MNDIPANIIVFGFIPEIFLMVWLGLRLLGIRISFFRITVISILQGLSIYYIRSYFDFNSMIFFQIITLIIYTRLIAGVRWPAAALSVILSNTIIILVEGCFLILFHGNGLDYIWWADWKRVLIFIPYDISLILILYICIKREISLLDEFKWLGRLVK